MSPLTLALFAALCSVAVCEEDKLYITADNTLKEVCVNGGPLELMEQANTVSRLDRMPMPANWNNGGQGCITVRARNANPRTWGGILACVKSQVLVNLYWQCVGMPELAGASCCGSCMNPIWDLPSSSNIIQLGTNQHRKKDYLKKLPAQCTAAKDQTKWIWDNNRLQPDVCCRSAPCAPLCDGCDATGPGQCDPGKCRFDATGQATPVCKSKCFVKAEIFSGNGPANYPKAEITNAATGDVYQLPIKNCQFAFMIDIATCRPVIKGTTEFTQGADDNAGTSLINTWASTQNPEFAGSFIVDMASGGASLPTPITLQFLGVQQSTGGGLLPNPEMYQAGIKAVSFTITGYAGSTTSEVASDIIVTLF